VISNINYKFTAMGKINYIVGDATRPEGDGKKIICHICNDIGAWGKGFVLALSKRWSYPEDYYRSMPYYELGSVIVLEVEPDLYVANMIAQHMTKPSLDGTPPIRYEAVKKALIRVNEIAIEKNATLHMPRIGTGYAGGDWKTIETILKAVVTVDVTVYDLN
jgi:O-acetyl-ADP-ribose deacetylase (regulator of RNase III)